MLDRHDIIYAYGPIERFERTLVANGATHGEGPRLDGVHAHHYHAEWDESERAVLRYGEWEVHPLQPSDVQFEGGSPQPEA